MVSTYDSSREAFDTSSDLKPYTIAKRYDDYYLRHTDLKHTIVHPSTLKNESETKQFYISSQFRNVQQLSITREDVAEALVSVLTNETLQDSEFQIINGNLSLLEATTKYLEE